MQRRTLLSPVVITSVLILQLIPLLLFPSDSYSLKTQEWWLPVLLVIMILIADFQIIIRRTVSLGPWYLLAFAQGFNIISRLMMLFPHATVAVNKINVPNMTYIVLTVLSILFSLFVLWYTEKAEVRMAFLPR